MSDFEKWRAFFANDRYAELAGIGLLEAENGRAKASLTVNDSHMNALGIVHGGALFTLADFTFAVAANSHGRRAVLIQASMTFSRPTTGGTLTADAREVSRTRTLGNYEISIRNQAGKIVATFTGVAYITDQEIGG